MFVIISGKRYFPTRMKQRRLRRLHLHTSIVFQRSKAIKSFHWVVLALCFSVAVSFLFKGAGRFCRVAGCCRIFELGRMHLVPSVGTRGSELDPDPAPGVKVWYLGEALGPAPGDPERLSACNADSRKARASAEAGPDFPEEAWVPVDTDPGPPETCTTEWTVCTGVSEETKMRSV